MEERMGKGNNEGQRWERAGKDGGDGGKMKGGKNG